MIPYVQDAIKSLSQKILVGVLPEISSTYVMSVTGMMAMLLNALADEAESGVARRLVDIAAMATILEEARELGIAIKVPTVEPASYELLAVSECHDRMTNALIELQTKIEEQPSFDDLNQSIWRYLAESQERHALSI